jgi:hypothetical protein
MKEDKKVERHGRRFSTEDRMFGKDMRRIPEGTACLLGALCTVWGSEPWTGRARSKKEALAPMLTVTKRKKEERLSERRKDMARSKEGSMKGQDRVKQDSLEAARPSSAPENSTRKHLINNTKTNKLKRGAAQHELGKRACQ